MLRAITAMIVLGLGVAHADLISFDDLPPSSPIGDAYMPQGVRFLRGDGEYGTSTMTIGSAYTFNRFAVSPPNILIPEVASNNDIWVLFYDEDGTPTSARFVSIQNDTEAQPERVVLEAFDQGGVSLGLSVGAGPGGLAAVSRTGIWLAKIYSEPGTSGYLGVDNFGFALASDLGDADWDGDLDLADFSRMQFCFTGMDGGPAEGTCGLFDFNSDDDVDGDDFEEFVEHFNGPQ